jgi:hypothetical protein
MKTFIHYETRERRFINWFINQKKEHKLEELSQIGSGERNDFVMVSGNTYIMGEVKVRTFELDKYPTAILELSKLKALTELFNPYRKMDDNAKLLYFAVYPQSRTIALIDLINTPMTISYEWCPITTAADNGSCEKVMVNYNINDVIKIKY